MNGRDRILMVDDSRGMRRIIRMAVEAIGYEALEATNGRDALEILRKCAESIALVTLDWNMPIMDGMETLQAIAADERLRTVPVMMVTTEGERSNVILALQLGARHYLHKPFSQQDLMVRMLECLGRGLTG